MYFLDWDTAIPRNIKIYNQYLWNKVALDQAMVDEPSIEGKISKNPFLEFREANTINDNERESYA